MFGFVQGHGDGRLRPHRLILITGVLAGLGWGCSSNGTGSPIDASGKETLGISDAGRDTRTTLISVDFTVLGCPQFDATKGECRGPAPLTVSFVPIASDDVTRFVWDFGDLARSSDNLPSHTYTLPGKYDVTITGFPAIAFQTHPGFIVVTPDAIGDSCDLDSQCEPGLTCLCGLAAKCPAAFSRGLCTRGCPQTACPTSSFCANLAIGSGAPSADEPWRGMHCLRSCVQDTQCPIGHRCRLIPTSDAPDKWAKGCFPDFPADLGQGCRGGNGALENDLCLSGFCADLGALGMCTIDCAARTCPTGTACAAFNDGRKFCVPPCDASNSCSADPLLTCNLPGQLGPLGFTIVGAPVSGTFCAPKTCDADGVCAPSGICTGAPATGHCERSPKAP